MFVKSRKLFTAALLGAVAASFVGGRKVSPSQFKPATEPPQKSINQIKTRVATAIIVDEKGKFVTQGFADLQKINGETKPMNADLLREKILQKACLSNSSSLVNLPDDKRTYRIFFDENASLKKFTWGKTCNLDLVQSSSKNLPEQLKPAQRVSTITINEKNGEPSFTLYVDQMGSLNNKSQIPKRSDFVKEVPLILVEETPLGQVFTDIKGVLYHIIIQRHNEKIRQLPPSLIEKYPYTLTQKTLTKAQ